MSYTWDVLIIAVLVVAIIMLVTGNGEKFMNFFAGKNGAKGYQGYNKEKTEKASLVFCVVLLLNEIVILVVPSSVVIGIATILVGIGSMLVYIWYLKKYCKE